MERKTKSSMFDHVPQKSRAYEPNQVESDHVDNWNKIDPLAIVKQSVINGPVGKFVPVARRIRPK